MSDSPAVSWIKVLGASGVIALLGRGFERLWRSLIEKPLARAQAAQARAEHDADEWRSRYFAVAGELKATHEALKGVLRADGAPPDSLPPPRAELPTIDVLVEGPAVRARAFEHAITVTPSPPKRRGPPPPPVRVIETYSVSARPTLPAPPGATPDAPVSLAPPMARPAAPPRPPSARRPR